MRAPRGSGIIQGAGAAGVRRRALDSACDRRRSSCTPFCCGPVVRPSAQAYDVGIAGWTMTRDAAGFLEAHASSGAGIRGLVDAVADDVAGPNHPCLARAERVGSVPRQGADCGDTLAVKTGVKVAPLWSTSNAAGRGAGVDGGDRPGHPPGRDPVCPPGTMNRHLSGSGSACCPSPPLLRTAGATIVVSASIAPRRGRRAALS
jgi:hypothetical protein